MERKKPRLDRPDTPDSSSSFYSSDSQSSAGHMLPAREDSDSMYTIGFARSVVCVHLPLFHIYIHT